MGVTMARLRISAKVLPPTNARTANKRFWLVRAITDELGTRPDIPARVTWVGNTDGEVYVIVTPVDVDLSQCSGVEELEFEEAARILQRITDLSGDDVGDLWEVNVQ